MPKAKKQEVKTAKNTITQTVSKPSNKKKAPVKKTIKNTKVEHAVETPEVETTTSSLAQKYQPYLKDKRTYLVILVLGLLLLVFYKKSWFIAATVNGSPITNFEVLSQMNKQFRETTVNQLVNEKLILQEARKNNIVVTQTDVDQKIIEIEKSVGGPQLLDNILSQQGQTRDSIKDQLKFMIIRDKLYEKEASVSAQEVQEFVEQNKAQLKATESAEQTKEATDIIKQQKIGQIFNDKFSQIRKDAKINIF